MTVRELLKTTTSEVWITTSEDPNNSTPEIKVKSYTERDESEFLSETVLDSKINILKSAGDAVYASLYWDKEVQI